MNEITFTAEAFAETGGYVARWDDAPEQGGITTRGDTVTELEAMVADAVEAYLAPDQRPKRVVSISWKTRS